MNIDLKRVYKDKKNISNYMCLTIKAKRGNEAFARNVVAAFCVELNPTVDQINDIKTAVSEAITNSIVHAYCDSDSGEIKLIAKIEGETLHIEISDSGVGINDIKKAMQPFFTTKSYDERSGMGFTVMESYMDSVVVKSEHGVTVTMTKNISSSKGESC